MISLLNCARKSSVMVARDSIDTTTKKNSFQQSVVVRNIKLNTI